MPYYHFSEKKTTAFFVKATVKEWKLVWEERIRLLRPYQVNAGVMANAKESAIFMHCLPSFHDTRTTIGAEISTSSWLNPRYSMPSYIRPSTRAVSAMDSFFPIWEDPGSR